MATTNQVSNNLLPIDVLTPDTLPGSAAKNSILNPLNSSNNQNIGGSALIDSKTQPVVATDKLSNSSDPLNSKSAIAPAISDKKSDDSLIVTDPLKNSLNGSNGSKTVAEKSGADVKDTLTGISKDAPLSVTKDDTLSATDTLTNPQKAEKTTSDKTPGTSDAKEAKIDQTSSVAETKAKTTALAEKETKPESAIAQTSSVAETKAKTTALAEKETKPESAIAQTPSVSDKKETATSEAIKPDNSTADKPIATATATSKDSKQETSPTNSTESNKKSTDNTEVAAVEIPKELTPTVPRSNLAADNSFTSGKFVIDSIGQVSIDYLYDGGFYKGQLAIFSLKGMEKLAPGSEAFLKEAAARALSNSAKGHVVINDLSEGARFTGNLPEGNYNEGNYAGVKTFAMTPGDEFGMMLVPNGTVQEVLNNPAIGGDKRPLFSMVTANPAEGFHVGQIADVTGSGKIFTMEDMRVDSGSDRDYNDFVFQVRGATGKAVFLDEVINVEKDWRKTDMGQALIAYEKPYTAPKLEPAKEDVKPANTESKSVLDVPIADKSTTAPEKIEPASNSDTNKDAILATKVTPSEEAKKDSIVPVSTPTESVSKTEVTTLKEPSHEGSETGFFSTNTASQPTDSIKNPVSLLATGNDRAEKESILPVSPATESITKTEVNAADKTVTPAVKAEEKKDSIAPVSPATESITQTEVNAADKTVTPAVKVEDKKESIAPISPATESVTKTEVNDAEKTVTPAVKVEKEKESIAPISPATESVSKTEVTTSKEPDREGSETGFFSTNIAPQPTDWIKNPVSLLESGNNKEEQKSIAPVSVQPEIDINKNVTTSEKLSNLTEPQTQTNPNPPTAETDKIENPVILLNPEITRNRINIPTNNSLNLAPGVWTVDETGQVSFDFKVDAGFYEGEIAVINISGMEQYPLDSDAFKQEAIKRALSNSELGYIAISDRLEGARFSGEFGEPNINIGPYQGVKTFAMTPGAKFALMLVPNATVKEISESPSLSADKTPLFSIPAANPNSQAMLADFTGKGNTFGWEDIPGNSGDRDFNDLIFSISGATANVPEMAANVNANTQWLESKAGQEILNKALVNDRPPAIKPVSDVALTPAQPTRTIDLTQVFIDPEASTLKYEVVEGNSPSLDVSLQGNNLQLTGLARSGVTDVVIRSTDAAGNSVIHNFAVTTSNLSGESVANIDNALTDFTKILDRSSQTFGEVLSSDTGAESLGKLATVLAQYPDALSLFDRPDSLTKLGISQSNLPAIQQLLQSPEVAAEFGLSVSLGEAFSHPDSTGLDEFLLNADEAISLLPSDAKQPKVGFIDFTEGQHVQRVTSAFSSINSQAKYDTFTVDRGNWAEQLIRFVDEVKAKGENRAIANLSFDLSQLDDIGITTRYELTPEEQTAIQYARENNVLLVVSAGNTGGVMSALGQASKQFDNIITVGAIDRFESKTDYSAYGEGLDLMAPGGSWANDPNAFVGTSRSASYVTAAASLVWAANPALSLTQVKKLLIDTAADLNAPGWDKETGSGLVDVKGAIDRALSLEPTADEVKSDLQVSLFSGEGRVETLARAAS
ncbi:MAG: DUF4114 domain-containing protein, partial [Microcoleus sp.]